ncbi:MAG: hypothetical protein AAFY51_04715 [Pseudomonadota bacterium]
MRLGFKALLPASAIFLMPSLTNAQANEIAEEFFTALGGSAKVKTVGESSRVVRPFFEFETEVVGARFFKHKDSKQPFAEADRGLELFRQACSDFGGNLLSLEDDRTASFQERVSGHLTQPSGYKHQWKAKAAICESADGEPLAGYIAVLQDNSEIAINGDAGSKLFGALFGVSTPTAIYLFEPDLIPSREDVERKAIAQEQHAQATASSIERDHERAEVFRENLAIGDETNCGPVIDLRGPMAEIAVPVNRRAPNGETTFWSRIDRLSPAGFGVCTFGL